jgi:hypothetical protein
MTRTEQLKELRSNKRSSFSMARMGTMLQRHKLTEQDYRGEHSSTLAE